MEVNKGEAEKCRDIGAAAMRAGDFPRAVRFLKKSLQMYPLPGVEALLGHANAQMNGGGGNADGGGGSSSGSSTMNGGNDGSSRRRQQQQQQSTSSASAAPAAAAASSSNDPPRRSSSTASDGRSYTEEQVRVVENVLKSKEGGRGAHYRVLGLSQSATENEIKKAYRKISLKVHPDKNAAPHADEAFKAVGLAYATLSDTQKRAIYDRYGDEDPDNRGGGSGGGMRPGRGGVHMHGQEMSPEDIFNAFFGGGAMGGGPGFHVYGSGFGGPGVHFRTANFGPRGGGRRQRNAPGQQQQGQEPSGLGMLIQLLPVIMIMLASFMRFNEDGGAGSAFAPKTTMPGENKYFSLTHNPPFSHQLTTKLTSVKEIPYYVSDRFMRYYSRDRYQRGQVERMVERAYENYLVKECDGQIKYKEKLQRTADKAEQQHLRNVQEQRQKFASQCGAEGTCDGSPSHEHDREGNLDWKRKLRAAQEFELSRCEEIDDLFPNNSHRKEYKRKLAAATAASQKKKQQGFQSK